MAGKRSVSSEATQNKLRDALSQTERLPPSQLIAYQKRSLELMVRHAYEQCPFYRDRLAPLFRRDSTIDFDRWNDVPILDRAETIANKAGMLARETPVEAGKTHSGTTTGSSGTPLEVSTSMFNRTVAVALFHRSLRWHDVDYGGRVAEISIRHKNDAPLPDGLYSPRWSVWGDGDKYTLDVGASTVEQQLEWLVRTEAVYLRTYPTAARAILEEADRRNIRLPLTALFTVGETVPEKIRGGRPAHWPKTIDTYGTSEVGGVCSECAHGLYHVHVENAVLEVIAESGDPAAPGETGRVVITGLYTFAMPFIRYAIGDYAIAGGEPCACGMSLPTVRRILGRERNLFRFGDRTIWPSTSWTSLHGFVPHRYRQIAQVAPFELEFRYTPELEDQAEDIGGLETYLREIFDPRITVGLRRVPVPTRDRGQKIEDYVCEI